MTEPIAFIPGQLKPETGLLSRYLPPLPKGIVSTWLKEHLPASAWVIDPYGADPGLAAEAARAGYRVLVAANNPIARFLLEMAAKPIAEVELQSALAELAATRRGSERLELNIRGLYQSKCVACGSDVNVEAFLWERNASAPYAKIYRCQSCGESGEYETSQEDISRSKRFSESSLHHARALERVTSRDDPDRSHVEDALSVYLPRAVYALFTLVNKVESLVGTQAHIPSNLAPVQAARQRALFALLLSAFDQTSALWAHPVARARPRQLTIPPRYRENNVWMALEASIPLIASTESEVPLAIWPETPPLSGGISIFEGRLKDLGLEKQDSRLERIDFQAVVAALPRPNQAFWTLSALWSGWLWGRDALGPFKSVLRRRRYDWAWHTTALQAAASSLLPLLSERTAFFGLIGELEPGFLSSALLGGALGGFELQGLALRSAGDQAQITWTSHQNRTQPKTANLDSRQLFEVAAGSGIDYLKNCGEPASYLDLQAAALEKIFALGLPSALVSAPPADVYAQIQNTLENAFDFRHGFIRFGGNEKSPEAGKWWLREVENVDIPLKDRLEMALVRWLYRHSGCTLGEIDQAMCLAFPGLITPDLEWTEITLRSYGEQPNGPGGGWQLRPGDHPKARRADIEQVRSTLEAIGDRMGYKASGERSLVWQDTYGNARYAFHIFASATFAETLLNNEYPPGHSFLVLPGSRAELALYKLNHDARLRGAFERGWRFLKYRHVRRLSRAESFDPDQFEAQIGLDPLTEQPEQIRLL